VEIIFWGVRGSIPSPTTNTEIKRKLRRLVAGAVDEGVKTQTELERFWRRAPLSDKITFGGNTSCVEVRHRDASVILDAGSGLCPLGHHIANSRSAYKSPYHIFLTHYHWDHILGFPFFRPAYKKGNRIVIHSSSPDAANFFRAQQSIPFFPAPLEFMPAKISFKTIAPQQKERVGPFTISAVQLLHPGSATGFKLSCAGQNLVYLTDVELLKASPDAHLHYREFVRNVDVAIVDTQYGLLESHEKTDWGHSTAFHWIDLLHNQGVKNLFLFHYEPLRSDAEVADILEHSRQYLRRLYPRSPMKIHGSYEGQKFDIARGKAV